MLFVHVGECVPGKAHVRPVVDRESVGLEILGAPPGDVRASRETSTQQPVGVLAGRSPPGEWRDEELLRAGLEREPHVRRGSFVAVPGVCGCGAVRGAASSTRAVRRPKLLPGSARCPTSEGRSSVGVFVRDQSRSAVGVGWGDRGTRRLVSGTESVHAVFVGAVSAVADACARSLGHTRTKPA